MSTTDGPMELHPDFREFIASFVANEVRFLVVGGHALAAHGHPRYTKDLDVWVWLDPANADNIVASLDQFGFGDVGLTATDFLEPEVVVQLGRAPLRIDLRTNKLATGRLQDLADAEHLDTDARS